jgi:hypothetical protein
MVAASLVEQFVPELIMPVGDKCGSNMDRTKVVCQSDCLAAEQACNELKNEVQAL